MTARIFFEKLDDIIYAVAYDVKLGQYQHKEVLYAEISESLGAWKVVWTDDFSKPEFFDSLEEAKVYVCSNTNLHKPHSQSTQHYVGE